LPPSAPLTSTVHLDCLPPADTDAVVAETARHHELTLISMDLRARPTYEAIGVELVMLE
jgi:hypothetical protein